LRRVLRTGGGLYITVPVGAPERHGWVRALALEELDGLTADAPWSDVELTFYRHSPAGWVRATRDEVADARYRDHFTSGPPDESRIVAAEAVGCVRLIK
jgi:hypothetical protein